jgi:acetoin utilization deacetylase AcuC-like enzyme/GNAT superfamily N-acetyltransferase
MPPAPFGRRPEDAAMLRIRKIRDARTAGNRRAIADAQRIMRAQFPGIDSADIDKLPDQIEDPLKYRLVSELFVADDREERQQAFALLLIAPDLEFAYLDTISAAPGEGGGGIGAALYERVRDEARAVGAKGLYFECLPDDPRLSPDKATREQNRARLRFYERFGARPIAGTAYETPIAAGSADPPYLVFDGLDRFTLPRATALRRIVRAILERKYGDLCPPDYVAMVLRSIRRGSYALRPSRYLAAGTAGPAAAAGITIPLVVNEGHDIHHVRERGYVEAPVRISTILREFARTSLFDTVPMRRFGERHIREVHDAGLVEFIKRACAEQAADRSLYPYVFPIRNAARRPRVRSVLAGYYCIDTFTPLNRNVYPAARGAVNCALTAAALVQEGAPVAYALVRPPGHHAEHRVFGGFCYFNNAAVAAQYLSHHGRVAVLDIDFHHGNGTQDIFYERADVLTVSIHGHPSFAYPYFSGFANETGRAAGAGFNLNIPLKETITVERYRTAVEGALRRIARYRPDYLVLALGLDTAKEDPTGTWANRARDFHAIGELIGAVGVPIAVVQEGGYRVRTLGVNARNFFSGLAAAIGRHPQRRPAPPPAPLRDDYALDFREAVFSEDVRAIRDLVAAAGVFSAGEVAIACELADERIARGAAADYEFVFAEHAGQIVGYACYGPIPGTRARYDLYWIVVDTSARRLGVGAQLVARVEAAVHAAGGERLYVDTSTSGNYRPARDFYPRMGYRVAAELPEFYGPDDGKVIFVKQM